MAGAAVTRYQVTGDLLPLSHSVLKSPLQEAEDQGWGLSRGAPSQLPHLQAVGT